MLLKTNVVGLSPKYYDTDIGQYYLKFEEQPLTEIENDLVFSACTACLGEENPVTNMEVITAVNKRDNGLINNYYLVRAASSLSKQEQILTIELSNKVLNDVEQKAKEYEEANEANEAKEADEVEDILQSIDPDYANDPEYAEYPMNTVHKYIITNNYIDSVVGYLGSEDHPAHELSYSERRDIVIRPHNGMALLKLENAVGLADMLRLEIMHTYTMYKVYVEGDEEVKELVEQYGDFFDTLNRLILRNPVFGEEGLDTLLESIEMNKKHSNETNNASSTLEDISVGEFIAEANFTKLVAAFFFSGFERLQMMYEAIEDQQIPYWRHELESDTMKGAMGVFTEPSPSNFEPPKTNISNTKKSKQEQIAQEFGIDSSKLLNIANVKTDDFKWN